MIHAYKYKIQTIMDWSNDDYNIFVAKYEKVLNNNIGKTISIIYNQEYIDIVLSLYLYIYVERVHNPKAFLLALILNGLPSDKFNLNPNAIQTHFLYEFFDDELKNIIDEDVIHQVKFLCNPIPKESPDSFSYDKKYFDLILFNDFRTVFKAVVLGNNLIVYITDPKNIKFNAKSSLNVKEFTEAMYERLAKISNLNMKTLQQQKIDYFQEYINAKNRKE